MSVILPNLILFGAVTAAIVLAVVVMVRRSHRGERGQRNS